MSIYNALENVQDGRMPGIMFDPIAGTTKNCKSKTNRRGAMTGVFYYSNRNLMLQLKYSHETDTLLYSTHRRITDSEQTSIENNIPNNFAVDSRTATYYYLGINPKLTQIFSLLCLIKPFESDVQLSDKSIENLINKFNKAHQNIGKDISIPLFTI